MDVCRFEAEIDGCYHATTSREEDIAFVDKLYSLSSIVPNWHPPAMELFWDSAVNASKGPPELNEVVYVSPGVALYTRRAVKAFGPLFAEVGEFLPIDCDGGPYWVFHCFRMIDAIDPQESQIKYFNDGRIMHIQKYELLPEVVATCGIFRMETQPHRIYIRNDVRSRMIDLGVSGLRFEEIWSDRLV